MNKLAKSFQAVGIGLLLAAILLTAFNLWEDQQASLQTAAAVADIRRVQQQNTELAHPILPQSEEHQLPFYEEFPHVEMPIITSNGVSYIGTLEIPSQSLTMSIISDWSYSNLKSSPCRYSGSAYTKDLILCAHNYSTHFGCLASLAPGTQLRFTDCDNNVFFYEVTSMEILQPEDTETIQQGDWDLTLFTCTLSGGSRVTLRCNLVHAIPFTA